MTTPPPASAVAVPAVSEVTLTTTPLCPVDVLADLEALPTTTLRLVSLAATTTTITRAV